MNQPTANKQGSAASRADAGPIPDELYAKHKKVYPREVHGVFANLRVTGVVVLLGLYYGLAWLPWAGRQAVLFDLPARKFYIFDWVFWPQDFFYLALLLILAAVSLFFFTAIAGRLWCGYACPQTVWTEIFLWMERKIEGDRPQQMKLDRGAWNARKLRLKLSKHAVWIAFSLWTGFTFVGYFTPIRELWGSVWSFDLGPWETFWVLFYGFATYGNAGWMREQVCIYMCPYARFQSAMFDRDTLIISYDEDRGEPRGSRKKGADHQAARPGRLHRLHAVRAGLPHRHRHPQRPAIPVHRLRCLHRCLRSGDGQDGLSQGPDPLHHRKRHEPAAEPVCCGHAYRDLFGDPGADGGRPGVGAWQPGYRWSWTSSATATRCTAWRRPDWWKTSTPCAW